MRVAGPIVGKDVEVVVSVGVGGEAAFLSAAGVVRVRGGGDGLEVAPGVYSVVFPPAMGWACGVRRGG